MKGAEVVSITHVAYKSKKVRVGQGGRVTLEDADFDVPEITVTKKPLVYAQTYYRMVYQNDDPDLPVYYYRAGVLNNSYDKKTKKVSSDENHLSICNNGILKAALNPILNAHIKQMANLKTGKLETRMKNNLKEIGLNFVPDGPGKQRITDKFGTVGSVTDNQGQGERRYSYDSHQLRLPKIQVTGSDKTNIMMQVFTVDRAYVTKDELKQLKKENKMKMTYQNLQQFERGHKIPSLPAEIQKRINEAMK